ncbi:TonB-dependent receptor domain-containing protein [Synechococcus sp. BDU 130192]|uniref:TonB-dependent receptor domain-containing protein n=1 Tax=Synechococcus sp. BDU 130192 TaxID=2042059 RepID=UPI001C1F81AF|nr:TonB-dependent receptor [Synechococcus sp. BDU 130192]
MSITEIQVVPTATQLEIFLETTAEGIQPTFLVEGDRLIVEIPNARLQLETGDKFTAIAPFTGIIDVVMTQQGENTVQLVIRGDQNTPNVELLSSPTGLTLGVLPGLTVAESISDLDDFETLELVVTATRTAETTDDVPRSVTVIDRETIETQANLTRNLPEILGKLVPGLGAPPSESGPRALLQTLRGRRAVILVDGVPLTSNYGLDRELRTIDPDTVERVEIVRGPTAIYGAQATGGVINIITRRPDDRPVTVTAEVGTELSLSHLNDSFGNTLGLGVSGKDDVFDYVLSLRREDNGAFFDAEGDRIPETSGGGLIDAKAYSVLAKAGVDLDENQRLQLTFDFYDADQERNFISDPIVNSIPGLQKARALAVNYNVEGTDLAGDQNLLLNLDYNHENVFGSQVQAQAYYRDYTSIVGAGDFRGGFFDAIVRQRAKGDKWGGRLQVNTPIALGGSDVNLLWGLDYVRENNEAPLEVFDGTAFDADQTLRKIDERTFVPLYGLNQLGLFAQLQWDVSKQFLVSGGIRHERIGLEVDDYTTFFGVPIQGGELDFDATVFNIGSVYNVTDSVNIFASFAQGFSVPTFGGVLRQPPSRFTNVEQNLDLTEPIKVNNYEIGIRGDWRNIQASLSAFYNTSDLGEDYTFVNGISQLVRAPERYYGIEATVDADLGEAWQIGGTFSWAEGDNDPSGEGDFLPISTFNVQPAKLTAYLEHQTTNDWRNRLQFLYVGNRDRAFEQGVDAAAIKDYFVVDYISNMKLGKGNLQIGIQNLLNNQYIPVQSQFVGGFNETFNAAARGITFRLGYSVEF